MREMVGSQKWTSRGPEVLHGRVVLGANADAMPSDDAFVVLRVFSGATGENPARTAMVRETVLPVITEASGFIAHHEFADDRVAGQAVAISVFDTEEHAMASHGQVLTTIDRHEKLKEALPNPPQVTAGRVMVFDKP